jgi:PIN domain nuclease of toxin-antitoxin system
LTEVVLDASAVVALIRQEAGWEIVNDHHRHSVVSAVNLAEAATALRKYDTPIETAQALLRQFFPSIIPFDAEQAFVLASLHDSTRHAGLSLGDCACLALALSTGAKAVTADTNWKGLKLGVKIVLIR